MVHQTSEGQSFSVLTEVKRGRRPEFSTNNKDLKTHCKFIDFHIIELHLVHQDHDKNMNEIEISIKKKTL